MSGGRPDSIIVIHHLGYWEGWRGNKSKRKQANYMNEGCPEVSYSWP